MPRVWFGYREMGRENVRGGGEGKIRRRLLRNSRLQGDKSEELDAKRKELERLKALTREIMLELGMKPPSRLWLLYEEYTLSISFAVGAVIIVATCVAFRYADIYLDELAHAELVAEEPNSQIQQIAPILSAAVQLQNNGNQQMVTEMADVTETMRGTQDMRAAIVEAAQQMMKGVDTAAFLTNAGKMAFSKQQAQLSPGEVEPAPVNIDTIGGVSDLMGASSFAPATLDEISPPLIEHGHENVLSILTEKKVIPDPIDPEAPDIVVEAIDELDGSMLVDLMSTLARDQEWDQYLLGHVRDFLNELKFDEASELSNRIQNPVVRVSVFGDMMVSRSLNEQPHEIRLLMARVRLDVDRIEDTDTRAMVMLNLGQQLGNAGITGQPEESIERVVGMAADESDNLSKSGLHSRLAVAFFTNENIAKTKQHFREALTAAGKLEELAQRIDAFTRIAQRYYDARNTTLANEILSEASVLAASELEPETRATAFGKVAMAQAIWVILWVRGCP